MRSFSNLWYWIALAVVWSSASRWVLGVPYDMVLRAKRHGGQAQTDLEDMIRINVNRMLFISQVSGLWLLGLAMFSLTSLAILGFWYWMEIAQAVFLLVFPMSIVGLLSLATARLVQETAPAGAELRSKLSRHRFWIQLIGMVSILATAMFGMSQNMSIGALG
jgi:hypothetical protein